MVELTGLKPDPDCLHCTIAPEIERAIARRSIGQVVGELLQSVGELIASRATTPQDLEASIAAACATLERQTREADRGFRACGVKS